MYVRGGQRKYVGECVHLTMMGKFKEWSIDKGQTDQLQEGRTYIGLMDRL